MKILALVKGPHYPSTRYRILQFQRPLAERGWTLSIREFPRRGREWRAVLPEARGHDVLWIQKKRLSPARLGFLRRSGAKLVYDVDDAVMVSSSGYPSWTRHWRFARACEGVDAVTAGNDFLASLSALWNPNVRVVPTVLDVGKYAVRPAGEGTNGEGVLGWIGGHKDMNVLG